MRTGRKPRPLLTVLAALVSLQLGARCGGGSGDPASPSAGLRLDPAEVVYWDAGYFLRVDVIASTSAPLQAVDLTLVWNAEVLEPVWTGPGADFDDDGHFFGEAQVDPVLGRTHFVDLRHGASGTTGEVVVAQTWLWARDGGTANVSIEGSMASDAGEPFQIVPEDEGAFPFTP
jgi:hypothetical protein